MERREIEAETEKEDGTRSRKKNFTAGSRGPRSPFPRACAFPEVVQHAASTPGNSGAGCFRAYT